MNGIISQTRLIGETEAEQIRKEFADRDDLITGNSFPDLLDRIDDIVRQKGE